MTQDGSLYYGTFSDGNNIYLAPYDAQMEDVSGEPTLAIQHRWGSNWAPSWSPDGRHLAWVSSGPQFIRSSAGLEGKGPYHFLIRAMETRQGR